MTKQNQPHNNSNIGTRPNRIKFKPSLTKRTTDILEYADNVVTDIRAVEFAYANMHGNLKMMFNEPVNRKFVNAFDSNMELAKVIAKIDYEDPCDMCRYDES